MGASRVGVVVIGRNEGERLLLSLDSVRGGSRPVVYVDSGSTDDSCARAAERGATVVELDPAEPFTAARGREAGFERLLDDHPEVDHVQFVDGDCQVVPGWIEAAAAELDGDPRLAAVCGYLSERFPERSVFNRICDVEWHLGAPGLTTTFGGNVMIRATALREAGGWNGAIVAGEEGELALRLRRAGHLLLRLGQESMIHDVDMHHPSQWWRRATRTGYSYAQVTHLQGDDADAELQRDQRRALLWGLVAPAGALLLAPCTLGASCLAFARYPAVGLRVALRTRRDGFPWPHAVAWGVSCALAPLPEAVGVAAFHLDALRGIRARLVEHRGRG